MTTQFRTTLQPDAALVQSAAYRMNGTDRQNIDQQVVDLQTLLSLALLNGVAATYVVVDTESNDIVKGDVVCRAPTTALKFTLADATALAAAGGVFGIALAAASAGARCLVAFAGAVSPDVTGLATGAAGAVRVSSAGRCERVGALLPGDYALGDVDAFGWLTMNLAPGAVAGASTVTFEDVRDAVAVGDTATEWNGQILALVGDPDQPQDAATKNYVDNRYTGDGGIDITGGVVTPVYAEVGALSAINGGDTASAGVTDTIARGDHQHAVSTSAPLTLNIGDAQSVGSSTSLSRSDHVHAVPAPAAPANVTKAAASAGAATTFARADHKHDVTTAAASTIGTSNTEGAATSLARSDHVHAHGSQTVDTQHAMAVAGVSHGFIDKDDQTKLDGLSATAGNHNQVFGAASIALTGTDYLPPGYIDAVARPNPPSFGLAHGVRNVLIKYTARAGGSGAGTITFTVRAGGAAQDSITVAANATTGSETTSFLMAEDDRVDIEITRSAALDSSPTDPMITLGWIG